MVRLHNLISINPSWITHSCNAQGAILSRDPVQTLRLWPLVQLLRLQLPNVRLQGFREV
jgi:hypothetical protein